MAKRKTLAKKGRKNRKTRKTPLLLKMKGGGFYTATIYNIDFEFDISSETDKYYIIVPSIHYFGGKDLQKMLNDTFTKYKTGVKHESLGIDTYTYRIFKNVANVPWSLNSTEKNGTQQFLDTFEKKRVVH